MIKKTPDKMFWHEFIRSVRCSFLIWCTELYEVYFLISNNIFLLVMLHHQRLHLLPHVTKLKSRVLCSHPWKYVDGSQLPLFIDKQNIEKFKRWIFHLISFSQPVNVQKRETTLVIIVISPDKLILLLQHRKISPILKKYLIPK